MDRRTAAAAASAVVLTVATGAVAVAANLGLLAADDAIAGTLQPVGASVEEGAPASDPVEVATISIDETVQASPPATPAAATATSTGRGGDDRDDAEWEDAEWEDDDHEAGEHDDHEDEDEHYEGGQDDD